MREGCANLWTRMAHSFLEVVGGSGGAGESEVEVLEKIR